MDRRYYRQYENFDTVVPKIEDFPVLDLKNQHNICEVQRLNNNANIFSGIKTDDIVLAGILVLLLMEEQKDVATILGIVFLLFAEYIF